MYCYDQIEKRLQDHKRTYPGRDQAKISYKRLVENFVGTRAQIEEYEKQIMTQFEKDYREMQHMWQDGQNAIIQEWKELMYTHYFEGYPRELFDLCYDHAYDDGHSAGYENIECCLNDLEEKFKKVFNLGRNSK